MTRNGTLSRHILSQIVSEDVETNLTAKDWLHREFRQYIENPTLNWTVDTPRADRGETYARVLGPHGAIVATLTLDSPRSASPKRRRTGYR